jgi:hypothetical protein
MTEDFSYQVGALRLPSGDFIIFLKEAESTCISRVNSHLESTTVYGGFGMSQSKKTGTLTPEVVSEKKVRLMLLMLLVPLRRWERMEYFLACCNMGLKLSYYQ